jgi:hypothetical protein
MSAKTAGEGKSGSVLISASAAKEKTLLKSTFSRVEKGSIRVTQISLSNVSRDESIMAERNMYNLGCNLGHHWFSPTPEEFIGPHKHCGHPSVHGGCRFPLHLLDEKGSLIN